MNSVESGEESCVGQGLERIGLNKLKRIPRLSPVVHARYVEPGAVVADRRPSGSTERVQQSRPCHETSPCRFRMLRSTSTGLVPLGSSASARAAAVSQFRQSW